MASPAFDSVLPFRVRDDRLSEKAQSQVQLHRLLSVLGAALVLGFGPLYALSNPDAVDPLWARLGVAGLLLALFGASYVSRRVREAYVEGLRGLLYILTGWFVVIAVLNQFSGDYVMGLLLVYAVLTGVVAFGADSVRPVFWFLGYGWGLTAAGCLVETSVRTSSLILLVCMGTIALVGGILTQGWLWIRTTVREQEARLQGLTNSLPGVVFQFYARDDGTVGHHFVSEHAEEILGVEADPETFHEQCMACIPDAAREEMEESIETAIEQEMAWEFETPFDRPDGERVWALGASTPERRENELVFNGVILDITERKEAERALREERDRFETLFETLPTPVVRCEVQEEGVFVTDANPAFENTFGLAAAEATGMEVNELLMPAEGRERARSFDRRVLEEGFVQAEVERATADGTRDFQIQAACRRPAEGPPEIYTIYTDITERKRRERRLKAIFNHTYQFTGLMTPDGTMVEANDTALRFGGLDREDIVGTPIWETHWAQTGEASKQRLQKAVERAAKGEFVRYERPIQGGDEERIIDFSIRPVTDDGDTVELLIPEARDITELKRREQKLRAAKEEAEEASRLKSAMLANMSHELRTPLTSILGFAEAIGEETAGEGGAVSRFASLIEKSGKRLLRTFDNVLNLSRLEAEREEDAIEPVDVAAQAQTVAEELREWAAEAEVSLHTEGVETTARAAADVEEIRIVVRHLLSNAIKYTASGGDVWLRVAVPVDTVILEIEDTGIGMEPDAVPELFEPFRQASEGLDREYEGTGLGLTVARRAVDRMGGAINVETEPEVGTRVTVTLPAVETEDAEGASRET